MTTDSHDRVGRLAREGGEPQLPELHRRIEQCEACPRLCAWRSEIARTKVRRYRREPYWGKPVAGFGDPQARLVIIGLAPGAHGANRTGRVFTGDSSGEWLYSAMHRHGFSSRPVSTARDDGLELHGAWITNIVRCVPPGNRPLADEVRRCSPFLAEELHALRRARVYLALGKQSFDHIWSLTRTPMEAADDVRPTFAHHTVLPLPGQRVLVASYHPSQQNTRTGRLTPAMWDGVFATVRHLCDSFGQDG
ncbi:MAG: uracil-DNA glycosylase [Firmicutes bacterium]|nr:uracil-DNA glycosylase [Bacillota bacterium]